MGTICGSVVVKQERVGMYAQSDSQPQEWLRYDVRENRSKQCSRAKNKNAGDDTNPGGQGNDIAQVKRHVNTLFEEHQIMPRSGSGVARGSEGETCS